jgi:hypothetical protein
MHNDPCKAFKIICFWEKEIEKQTKIVIHMDLWKYDQISTIQKVHNYQTVKVFK